MTEETSQLEKSALTSGRFTKRLFIFVTSEVSKHLIASLSEEFSNKMFVILSSSTIIPSGQGLDLTLFKDFDPDPPFFPFRVLDSVDFDDLDSEDVGSGNGNDNDNGNVNEFVYLL